MGYAVPITIGIRCAKYKRAIPVLLKYLHNPDGILRHQAFFDTANFIAVINRVGATLTGNISTNSA